MPAAPYWASRELADYLSSTFNGRPETSQVTLPPLHLPLCWPGQPFAREPAQLRACRASSPAQTAPLRPLSWPPDALGRSEPCAWLGASNIHKAQPFEPLEASLRTRRSLF